MSLSLRKSKTISFRLTPAEHQRFQDLCTRRGLPSISELARTALLNLTASESNSDPLTYEVRDLREQVQSLSLALDRISQRAVGSNLGGN